MFPFDGDTYTLPIVVSGRTSFVQSPYENENNSAQNTFTVSNLESDRRAVDIPTFVNRAVINRVSEDIITCV